LSSNDFISRCTLDQVYVIRERIPIDRSACSPMTRKYSQIIVNIVNISKLSGIWDTVLEFNFTDTINYKNIYSKNTIFGTELEIKLFLIYLFNVL